MSRAWRVPLAGSLLVNLVAGAVLACKPAARSPPPGRDDAEARGTLLEMPAPRGADVVMLGDSLTDWAEWSELLPLPGVRIANRGVAGDTTEDVLARLAGVTALAPRVVALLVGVNDLLRGRAPAEVAAGVERIVAQLARELPGAILLIQGILPVDPRVLDARSIDLVNERLAAVAARHGARLIDVSAGVREALSEDGLHLTGAAYLRWAAALRPHLEAALGR